MAGALFDPLLRTYRFNGRYEKPRYYSAVDNIVVVPGSDNAPAWFVIGGRVYKSTSDLECNLLSSGLGGLNRGSITMNTAYYLYGVLSDQALYLLADVTGPADGPQGIDNWTYIGAFSTDESVNRTQPFQSIGGFYLSCEDVEDQVASAGAGRTQLTFQSFPTTGRMMWCSMLLGVGAGGAGQYNEVHSYDHAHEAMDQVAQVASTNIYTFGWVPILSEKTIWASPSANCNVVVYYRGFIEDVNAYK